jgi:hypothetical protein
MVLFCHQAKTLPYFSCFFQIWNCCNNPRLIDLFFEKSKLTFIQSHSSTDAVVGEIVDHFGPPEFFKAVMASAIDGSNYILEVYYPKLGVAFVVSPNQADIGQIKPNMPIKSIHYFVPGTLLSYLTTRYSCNLGKEDAFLRAQGEIKEYIQSWTGFGNVKTIKNSH